MGGKRNFKIIETKVKTGQVEMPRIIESTVSVYGTSHVVTVPSSLHRNTRVRVEVLD